MDKTTEDAPAEVTSSEDPVPLVDDQHLSDGRQCNSGVPIKTERAALRGDHTSSHFFSSASDHTENADSEDCVSETMFATESEKPVSTVDSLNKNQLTSLNTKALPSTTSCSIDLVDISTIEETISLLNDKEERSKSGSGLVRSNNILPSTEQVKQPPRKKLKLSRSIKVPVKDLLSGIHTTLCKHDCTCKHNPLVLAICIPEGHELKDCLENHWKLIITGTWKSAPCSLYPRSVKCWVSLVHLTVLFGKYNLLEDLLRVHLDCSELHVASAQNSPLHAVLKCIHHFMPSSSHQEKLRAFQCILHLFAKYNYNILLVRDRANEDTILHVCAKKIKDLTNEIQSLQSPAHPDEAAHELRLQGLVNQRQLLEGILKEVIHTMKRLCADGSLCHNQVIELFDCANNVGETMSQILKEDESARNGRQVIANQKASTLHEEENTCEKQQKKRVVEENVGTVMTEGTSQLITVARSSGSCAAENDNSHVSTQVAECQFAQTPNGCPKPSSSSTQSALLPPAQTVAINQAENSIGTTILSTECQSVQAPNGCSKQSPSTIATFPLLPSQTVESSVETPILSTEFQSIQMPNGCPNQPTATTVSVSGRLPQTVLSMQVANPLFSTTILTDCSSSQTSSGCPKQSTSTVSAAFDLEPSTTVENIQAQVRWTMPVNSVRQQSGKHTFLCTQGCTLKHHKLVELLCSTPDHLSTGTASVEAQSCADLRDDLRKNCWDISKVVPDLDPSLRLPIVHLACFLGKHKALEVLSEFCLRPLHRTAKTEETPLHMTVQLLRHQTSNSIFLPDVVVSIVKTLNQHSHPISLFSAKDIKGNSVLHAMAELISSNIPEAVTLLCVYLFRVFVHFILKEQHCISKSGSLHILSSLLKDCNKAGQNVESLLQKSIHGEQLLEYLKGLQEKGRLEMSSETIVETRRDSSGLPEGQHFVCMVQKHAGTQREMNKEPKSLVDFILSPDCKISHASKKRIVDCYIGEYERRLQLARADVASVREEMASAKTSLEMNLIEREKLRVMESKVRLDAKIMKLWEGELKEKRREQVLLHKQLQLLEELQKTVNERLGSAM